MTRPPASFGVGALVAVDSGFERFRRASYRLAERPMATLLWRY
jgi:hypothetical protein